MENERPRSITLTIGWILLFIAGLLITLGALGSLGVAYFGSDDVVGGASLADLAKLGEEVPSAVRGRRATAASFAFATGVLTCWIAATAYRRREKWAWYALLTGVGVAGALSILRVSMIGIRAGTGSALLLEIVLLAGLLISYRDFRR